jgi:hypothetical protein
VVSAPRRNESAAEFHFQWCQGRYVPDDQIAEAFPRWVGLAALRAGGGDVSVKERLLAIGGTEVRMTREMAEQKLSALKAAVQAYKQHGGVNSAELMGALLGDLIERQGEETMRCIIEKLFTIYAANQEFVQRLNAGEDAVLKIPGDG